MEIKDEIFHYLIDIEEEKAAEIVRESDFKGSFEDVVFVGEDEWYVYTYQILIRGIFLKEIETSLKQEKKCIEDALKKFAETENQHVRFISWLPLPRIYSQILKYNQNDRMKQNLIDNDFDSFFNDMKSIFASLSYQIKITEAYFHSNIHIFLKTLGFNIESENETNLGRIDSVIEFDKKILIFEFKTSSSKIAIDQIKARKYFEKYIIKNKEIILIGVAFSIVERNISDWKIEKYNT